ncbi:hypothetical protein [Legionella spiritensis]|uniref:Uncharacterized protein n=1 Tax=Legionella spiritensis TaxID=452 RepID=A0A0W0YZ49_LEGSP|nr:hypothetical protein [Legionella spiritensis]KTD61859.1 hypothetical protein Lspi_2489 [Legionella spiritensis]SNV31416.1 Uncharacterised protein [Legionella spiritensis]
MNTKHDAGLQDTRKTPKNICPICEALGFPICKGHGGGKSSGSKEEKEEHDDKKINADSTSQIIMSLVLSKPSPDLDRPGIDITTRSRSLLDIEIDAGNNRLCFTRGSVSIETFNRLKELLENALEEFKKANPDESKQLGNINFIADNENMVIQMPSSKLFNSFVKQLMHDNLLPRLRTPITNIVKQNQSDSMDDGLSNPAISNTDKHSETQDPNKTTAPTPLSMVISPKNN